MNLEGYACPRCRNAGQEIGEFRAAGGILSKIFDVSTKNFTAVTCTRCRHVDLFAVDSSRFGDVVDFLAT